VRPAQPARPGLSARRIWLPAVVVGVIGLALTLVAGLSGNSAGFFRSYLMGYTFWLGLGLGSLGVALVQFLTGGHWGLATRRIFEAGAATLPLMAVLFIPLLLGLPQLYVWARPEAVAADPVLQHKAVYLNIPFFVGRTAAYLISWVVLAWLLRRWSAAQDQTGDPVMLRRLQRLSIVGALVLGLTVSFAAIDWLMSLDAEWFSTMYPPMVSMGDMLLALAFGIVVVAVLAPASRLGDVLAPQVYNDLGSLLLAFLMLWAYMAYFQYLLIWSGNLSDEIPWYLRRIEGGWLPVAVVVGAVGFMLPFYLLLFRPLKRNRRTLAAIAGLLIAVRLIDVFWLVEPPFEPGGPSVNWPDVFAVVGFGGLWLAVFSWQLAARPLLPPNDPRLRPAMEAAHEPA
jgi:hypothetical protein